MAHSLLCVQLSRKKKIHGNSVLDITTVFHFSLRPLSETHFAHINILRVTIEMDAETQVGLHAKFPLFFVRFEPKLEYIHKCYQI
jgi:hypothetical protein